MIIANSSTSKTSELLEVSNRHKQAMAAAEKAPEKLKTVKAVLKDCLARNIGFDEFRVLCFKRISASELLQEATL